MTTAYVSPDELALVQRQLEEAHRQITMQREALVRARNALGAAAHALGHAGQVRASRATLAAVDDVLDVLGESTTGSRVGAVVEGCRP